MKNFKLMAIVALIVASLGLTACNSSNVDDNQVYYSNVVTYEGGAGGLMTFSFQEMNDSQPITFRAQGTMPGDVLIGQRVYVSFTTPATGLTDGMTVTLTQCVAIPNVKASLVDPIPSNWMDISAIYLQTMFRSGKWINMAALVPSNTESAITPKFMIDPVTVNNDYPDAYLFFENLGTGASNGSVNSATLIATYDISEVWNLSTCLGINIHVNNTNSSVNGGSSQGCEVSAGGKLFTIKKL